MALPLAIPAVIAEGLVFIRRAIVTYRLTKSMVDPDDQIHLLVQKGLKNHFMVKGEEFYLYLVGERIISTIYDFNKVKPSIRLDEDQIQAVVIKTLADPSFLMSSVDVNSIVSSFAVALGMQWQDADNNADDYLVKLLTSDSDDADISDVVRKYLASDDDVPERIFTLAHRLGLVPEELSFIITLLKGDNDHAKTLTSWEIAETSFVGQGVPLFKASTFQSFMLMGAQSRSVIERSDVIAVPGVDGIALSMSYLPRGQSAPYKPDSYPDVVSITSEQIKSVSDRIMALQGMVYSDSSKAWIPLSQAEIKETDEDGVFINDTNASDSILLSKGIVQSKASSKMVFSWIEKFLRDQPFADDVTEWTEVLETGKNALKLLSNN